MPRPDISNAVRGSQEERWERQFARLAAFQRRFGHCRVPKRWREDPQLATWVGNQRLAYWRDTLRPDRLHRLVQIGFDGRGGLHACASWEDRLAELVEFKARFGHCDVPCKWSENRALGNWVSTQRRFMKSGLLSPERVRKLEALGFHRQLLLLKRLASRSDRNWIRELPLQLEALNRRWEKRLVAWRNAG